MTHRVLYLLCLLLTLMGGCHHQPLNSCHISGELAGLSHDTLLLWGADHLYPHIDTIPVVDGRFQADIPIDTLAEAVLYTPDGRQHPLYLERGAQLRITGSTDSLTVSGSVNDSIYALLRSAEALKADTAQLRTLVLGYLRRHPAEASSVYVIRHFYASGTAIQDAAADEALRELAPLMRDYPLIARLDDYTGKYTSITVGRNIPTFALPDTAGVVTNRFTYPEQPILLHFWASWSPESRAQARALRPLYEAQQKIRQKENRLALVGVSLDSDRHEWFTAIHADTLRWAQLCNFRSWDTDLVQRLGISELPYNILINDRGIIRGINLTPEEIEQELKAIREEYAEQKRNSRARR
ncbi:MAG: DUF4369 domain-containing protein [Bacteroidaceae bacterium]|nr:DUF4369 domain-containing protein [Bacteroidaceae bacterium]